MCIKNVQKYSVMVLTVISLLLVMTNNSVAMMFDKAWMASQFDNFDFALNKGEGYSKMTNEKAHLAWGQGWLLEAYLNMYEATGNKKYLKKFAVHSERVANNADKNRGVMDYKGRSKMGWSNTSYSKNGKPIVHLAHSGMILYPLVKFSLMVKDRPDLSEYNAMANRYKVMAEKAVAEFESVWKYDARTGQGNYWLEGDEPMTGVSRSTPQPFNGSLALGRVLVVLSQLTGEDAYRSKAMALALYFKTSLSKADSGAYVWPYRKDLAKPPEDFSHGATDVDFAVQAFKAGIVFTQADLEKFANTLLSCNKQGKLSMYVDCTDNPKKLADYSFSSIVWLEMSPVDCRPYKVAYDYVMNMLRTRKELSPMVLLGIAKLTKYYDVCHKVNTQD